MFVFLSLEFHYVLFLSLVNNVGMGYDHAQYFGVLTREKIQQIININIFGTVWMTHIVLPGMQRRLVLILFLLKKFVKQTC
jgi:short-subunit dehydrogenase